MILWSYTRHINRDKQKFTRWSHKFHALHTFISSMTLIKWSSSFFQRIPVPPYPRGICIGCSGSLSSTYFPIPFKFSCISFNSWIWQLKSQCSWIIHISIRLIISLKNGPQVWMFLQFKVTILRLSEFRGWLLVSLDASF